MDKQNIIDFFKSLKGKDYTSKEILSMLMKYNKYFDQEVILRFHLALNDYLPREIGLMKNKYSDEEINNAIAIRVQNNQPIPHKGGLGTNTKENSYRHLDIEALMFPNEFNALHKLKMILNEFPEDKLTRSHKEFSEYFDADISKDKIDWLLNVFNRNQSPQEYAMMISILIQQNLIIIKNRGMKDFIRAWYDFIGKDYGIKFSASEIYDYIDSTNRKYKIPKDPVYTDFENLVKKKFSKTI